MHSILWEDGRRVWRLRKFMSLDSPSKVGPYHPLLGGGHRVHCPLFSSITDFYSFDCSASNLWHSSLSVCTANLLHLRWSGRGAAPVQIHWLSILCCPNLRWYMPSSISAKIPGSSYSLCRIPKLLATAVCLHPPPLRFIPVGRVSALWLTKTGSTQHFTALILFSFWLLSSHEMAITKAGSDGGLHHFTQ